jgi:hypothetical protein
MDVPIILALLALYGALVAAILAIVTTFWIRLSTIASNIGVTQGQLEQMNLRLDSVNVAIVRLDTSIVRLDTRIDH